jgi:hypothetical protein
MSSNATKADWRARASQWAMFVEIREIISEFLSYLIILDIEFR